MRAQVFELCSDNFIHVLFQRYPKKAQAVINDRVILISPIKSTITYITALHELGHFLSKRSLTTKDDLASEAYAWQWAQKTAILWTPVAERHKNTCLKQYLQVEGKPKANHIFWKVYTG